MPPTKLLFFAVADVRGGPVVQRPARRVGQERVRAPDPETRGRQEGAAPEVGGFEPGSSELRARASGRRVQREVQRQLGQ